MLFSLWKRQNKYPCLEIGMLILRRQPEFLTDVKFFDWIDEDPSEWCDLLELFTRRKLKVFKNKIVFKKIHFL